MAITVNWPTGVISVPKADMTLVQSTPIEIRELDINSFRLTLKDLEDDEVGQVWATTHNHNTTVTVGGVTLARVVEIINGYTVTFENGSYAVNLVGANSNVADVVNLNSVSVRAANSAGLVNLQSLDAIKYQVESLRSTHQGFGETFYVSTSGSDTNSGTSPSSPKLTIAAALSLCITGRGDIVYLIAPDAGTATFAESITIDKEDVHFRGPGRGVQIQPTSGVPLTLSANNISISGLIVKAPAGSTTTDCLVITGKNCKLTKLYVVGTETGTGNGVVLRGGDYHELIGMEIEKMGGCGILFIDDGTANGSPREVTVSGGNIYLNGDCGIKLTGTSSNSTRLNRFENLRIYKNTECGIHIEANVQNTLINSTVDIFDNGTAEVTDVGSYTTDLRHHYEILNTKYQIEAMRRHHTGFGQIVYWNPTTGSDSYSGETAVRPKATYAAAEAMISSLEGGVIYLLGGSSGDVTVTERVNMTKEKVSLRGPGKSIILKPTDATGPTLTMTAANCYVSGLRVQTHTTGAENGIQINGDWAVVEDVFVESARGHGIYINGNGHHEILGVDVTSCLGDGIRILDSDRVRISQSKSGSPNRIQRCTGNGITIESTSSTVRCKDVLIEHLTTHHNGTYEIEIKANSSMTIVRNTTYLDPYEILDSGSGSHIQRVDDKVVIADAVWDELTASHVTAGTTGKALTDAGAAGNPWSTVVVGNTDAGTFGELVGKKLLTVGKFLGLK